MYYLAPGGGGRRLSRISNLEPGAWTTNLAFTMAEILLSLTIIGVVAAITLPSLTGNINERTWNTQRKALYARFSQAIALMPAMNGYGSTAENAAETFVTAGLSKVLKINNICDNTHLADCGIPNKVITTDGRTLNNFTESYNTLLTFNDMFSFEYSITNSTGSVVYSDSYSFNDYNAVAFETSNGESILAYYNPACQNDMNASSWHRIQPQMCANFVYDLNGSKGPNTVGKDIGFITALYPSDSIVVAPVPLATDALATVLSEASNKCRKMNSESRMPNKEELASIFYNKLLVGINDGNYWSASRISADRIWVLRFHGGYLYAAETSGGFSLRCIQR